MRSARLFRRTISRVHDASKRGSPASAGDLAGSITTNTISFGEWVNIEIELNNLEDEIQNFRAKGLGVLVLASFKVCSGGTIKTYRVIESVKIVGSGAYPSSTFRDEKAKFRQTCGEDLSAGYKNMYFWYGPSGNMEILSESQLISPSEYNKMREINRKIFGNM